MEDSRGYGGAIGVSNIRWQNNKNVTHFSEGQLGKGLSARQLIGGCFCYAIGCPAARWLADWLDGPTRHVFHRESGKMACPLGWPDILCAAALMMVDG